MNGQRTKRPILVMAGGTGGHVFPALAVAKKLQQLGYPIVWLGSRRGLEARVIPEAGFPVEWVNVRGLRGKGWWQRIQGLWSLCRALWQVFFILRRQNPLLVLGMGGFVTGPGGVMARVLGVPLVIHEQNAVAGLTNRLLSRVASKICEAFPQTFSPAMTYKVTHTGNPVREDICSLANKTGNVSNSGVPRLLVFGGSLGAEVFNRLVPETIRQLPEGGRPEVWHQCGKNNEESVKAAYGDVAGVRVTEFIHDMAAAYTWADLVICRSGALTVAELACAGVASILVPFPYAVDDHQTQNGRFLSAAGAAILQPQSSLTAPILKGHLQRLLADRVSLKTMQDAALGKARVHAVDEVVEICRGCIKDDNTSRVG
jgi:UDP-N-acetylglucosamine--N-acetylmuramyl-(pentapeptide) pyrophosphoryl-undecaprenol N-acetylglucosamine transferase